jgi:hypothetical protein
MTAAGSESESNVWLTAVYAGGITALVALATALLFRAEIPLLYIPAFLLIGAGPVLGFDLAKSQLGTDWKPLIGGILGFILLILGFILWPILVGAMSKTQSIGKLLVASIIGIVLGVVAFLILGSLIGQDPIWVVAGFTLLWAVWGGVCGAAMDAWGNDVAEA